MDMLGCIVSGTTASFCSVMKRRRRATPVMISTRENVSDIGIAPGLRLGSPAKADVRSKRGAVHLQHAAARVDGRESRAGMMGWQRSDQTVSRLIAGSTTQDRCANLERGLAEPVSPHWRRCKCGSERVGPRNLARSRAPAARSLQQGPRSVTMDQTRSQRLVRDAGQKERSRMRQFAPAGACCPEHSVGARGPGCCTRLTTRPRR
jgi:hypothetical protein